MRQNVTQLANSDTNTAEIPPLIPLLVFARQLGKTAPTIWRWRKLGMIDEGEIVNLCGKPYLTRAGADKFFTRARAGEFAKPSHAPKRVKEGK